MFTFHAFVGAGLPSFPYELPCVQIIMGFTISEIGLLISPSVVP